MSHLVEYVGVGQMVMLLLRVQLKAVEVADRADPIVGQEYLCSVRPSLQWTSFDIASRLSCATSRTVPECRLEPLALCDAVVPAACRRDGHRAALNGSH